MLYPTPPPCPACSRCYEHLRICCCLASCFDVLWDLKGICCQIKLSGQLESTEGDGDGDVNPTTKGKLSTPSSSLISKSQMLKPTPTLASIMATSAQQEPQLNTKPPASAGIRSDESEGSQEIHLFLQNGGPHLLCTSDQHDKFPPSFFATATKTLLF